MGTKEWMKRITLQCNHCPWFSFSRPSVSINHFMDIFDWVISLPFTCWIISLTRLYQMRVTTKVATKAAEKRPEAAADVDTDLFVWMLNWVLCCHSICSSYQEHVLIFNWKSYLWDTLKGCWINEIIRFMFYILTSHLIRGNRLSGGSLKMMITTLITLMTFSPNNRWPISKCLITIIIKNVLCVIIRLACVLVQFPPFSSAIPCVSEVTDALIWSVCYRGWKRPFRFFQPWQSNGKVGCLHYWTVKGIPTERLTNLV